MDAYDIPAETVSFSEEIKKSRFITLLQHTEGVMAAREFVQHIRQQHPDARHHCWAWVAGAPDDSQQLGFSDDGEPSGTAGKPMLAQLMGSGVGEVTAVVIRYYGGIQLGTGGLVKAYGNGVQQALKQLVRQRKVPMLTFRLCCDYAQLSDIERLIQWASGTLLASEFTEQVTLRLALPYGQIVGFTMRLSDLSRGGLNLEPLN
ncbi:YigZ family protein [Erwinia sp. OLTSP20]|uniref:IMPACT family protein n=1 Tax=unclassified Erwinia TaxID=2622719 RepID=UPI000C1A0C82|nr:MULTISPECIES: IMPACT family protein [unclassified Erwinia]PIJ50815.1 YigZ family protein [Erwinia sp. OAMSP11]PIJ72967.1 YigZ family protein [Erwinia sp. OLSSP12]PIJ81982.1 YigZ family protein [Erwinia sp. OLCASP19]PIJ84637.1 YigZ family protein [Erwinia sp. OLMTSP26]PIJ86986.1 YigZ family protein [Erwinia sp. OLMDSP33]